MPQKPPVRFGPLLALLARSWRAELDRRLAHLGLSQARWLVLLHVSRMLEPPTQRELAQIVGVEGPTLARLLDSLESQGYVRRLLVPEDRRAKKIVLTDEVQPLIQQIEAITAQMYHDLLSGIDESDLQTCMRVHQTILRNLNRS
ncbi:MarR family transcriptional regulator for hemolysin [Azomonas agilis]|uniref:MarR family transcriptional regulator for hemolysin n=1 Tax=Azomonas agilis TaxID=116849 RepID=A0A562J0K1_9GAMM|nr:MarR family transcriptional regulator [Azomonas agilis]TWH76653.1 MarR family transcriptional regulator for hemolysin [Azomonas agilis]